MHPFFVLILFIYGVFAGVVIGKMVMYFIGRRNMAREQRRYDMRMQAKRHDRS